MSVDANIRVDSAAAMAGRKGAIHHFNIQTMFNKEIGLVGMAKSAFPVFTSAEWTDRIDSWMRIDVAAGVDIVWLTLDHTGEFTLYPTATSGTQRYPAVDLAAIFVARARAWGLKIGVYVGLPADGGYYSRANVITRLNEVLTNYGPIDGIWFDRAGVAFPAGDYAAYRAVINGYTTPPLIRSNLHLTDNTNSELITEEEFPFAFTHQADLDEPFEVWDTLLENSTWLHHTGSGAVVTCSIDEEAEDGSLTAPVIANGGSGYIGEPDIFIPSPPSGTRATATATITDGVVTGFVFTNAGSGYVTPPTIVIRGFTAVRGYTDVMATTDYLNTYRGKLVSWNVPIAPEGYIDPVYSQAFAKMGNRCVDVARGRPVWASSTYAQGASTVRYSSENLQYGPQNATNGKLDDPTNLVITADGDDTPVVAIPIDDEIIAGACVWNVLGKNCFTYLKFSFWDAAGNLLWRSPAYAPTDISGDSLDPNALPKFAVDVPAGTPVVREVHLERYAPSGQKNIQISGIQVLKRIPPSSGGLRRGFERVSP